MPYSAGDTYVRTHIAIGGAAHVAIAFSFERVLSEALTDADDVQAVMALTSSASAARGMCCETAEVEMRDVASIDLSMFRRCQLASACTYVRRYRCGDLVVVYSVL